MKSTLNYRSFKEGDVPMLLALFKVVYKQELAEEEYRWYFLENPYGPVMTELAFDGDELVGHYAVCPAESSILGEVVRSARSMTTMTHPSYGGRGIFTKLARRLYDRILDEHSVEMVWGFPNTKSHFGFNKYLGWIDQFTLHYQRLNLGQLDVSASDEFEELQEVSPSLIRGWECESVRYCLPFKRDERFFKWRFLDRPGRRYRYLRMTRGGATGLAVLGTWREGETRTANIMELLDVAPSQLPKFMEALAGWAYRDGYRALSQWVDLRHPRYAVAEGLRFDVSSPLTYFGVCPLSRRVEAYLDPRLFRTTMSDSDVF
jgi:GNAT superfamily N-acetyltransferase